MRERSETRHAIFPIDHSNSVKLPPEIGQSQSVCVPVGAAGLSWFPCIKVQHEPRENTVKLAQGYLLNGKCTTSLLSPPTSSMVDQITNYI